MPERPRLSGSLPHIEEEYLLKADIPGFGRIEIEYLVSDFTGTLSRDGSLIRGVAGLIRKVSRFLEVRVLTFDTFGTAEHELRGLPCSVLVLSGERGDEQKRDCVARLGPERVVEAEGASTAAIAAATVACRDIASALGLLLNSKRLVATLRR